MRRQRAAFESLHPPRRRLPRRARRLRHARRLALVRAPRRRALQAPRPRHLARAPCRSSTRATAATRGPPEPVGAHRRVVRVPLAARQRTCSPASTSRVRWPGATATMAAARCTPQWVIPRSPTPSLASCATCWARSRWPPAARGSTVRPELLARACVIAALAFAACGGERAAEPTAPAAEPSAPAETADRGARDDRDRRRRHRQRRLQPRDQLGHGRPGRRHDHGRLRPGALPPASRAPRRPRSSTGDARGRARSPATSWCASRARTTCSPPATRRRATLPENLGLIRSERPRRDLGARPGPGGRLPRARDRRQADHRRQRRVARHPGLQRRRRELGDAHAAGGADRRRRQPGDAEQWAVSTEQGTFVSTNGGQSWRPRDTTFGARLVWPSKDALYSVDRNGKVRVSPDGGRSWEDRGEVGGLPSEVAVGRRGEVLAAVVGGKIRRSKDGGPHLVDASPLCTELARPKARLTFASQSFRSSLLIGLSSTSPVRGQQEEEAMKGISRRARACAVVAVTGVAVLAGASAANAQRPEKTGNGIPAGQASTQMFNYGSVPEQRRQHWRREPDHRRVGRVPDLDDDGVPSRAPRRPVRVLPEEGLDEHRALRALRLPGAERHSGPASRYRALLDKYGLHAAGWHGTVTDVGPAWTERIAASKILGMDYIGSGGVASPGIGTVARRPVRQHAGDRRDPEPPRQGVRRGRRGPRLHPQPHGRVRRQVRRQRRPRSPPGRS